MKSPCAVSQTGCVYLPFQGCYSAIHAPLSTSTSRIWSQDWVADLDFFLLFFFFLIGACVFVQLSSGESVVSLRVAGPDERGR